MSAGRTGAAREEILSRIQSEFIEMPGLSLRASEAARLWGLTIDECAALLVELVARGFLRRAHVRACSSDL